MVYAEVIFQGYMTKVHIIFQPLSGTNFPARLAMILKTKFQAKKWLFSRFYLVSSAKVVKKVTMLRAKIMTTTVQDVMEECQNISS